MIPSILNLPYFTSPVPMGPGGATLHLVAPVTAWLTMLAVIAGYGVLIHFLTKPFSRVRVVRRRHPRAPKRLVPRHA
jgi:hypothetical protein